MARIEIVQIVICLIGGSFNMWGVIDALRVGVVIRELGERRKREIEANAMRLSRELSRMVIQVVLVIAALIALGERGDMPPTWPTIVLADKLCFIGISIVSAYTSIRERIGAGRLLEIDDREMADRGVRKRRRHDDPAV